MKYLLLSVVFVLAISGTANGSSDWRSYARDCGGRRNCMKAQAAAYKSFNSGSYQDGFKKICKKREIRKHSRNYTGALRCVKQMQDSYNRQQAERASIERDRSATEYNRAASKYIRHEDAYRECRRRGGSKHRCSRK